MEQRNKRIADLLDEPSYSDLEIVCEKHVFRVHRSVVCLCSKVLKKECDGKFKEAGSRKIEHNVFDRFSVDRMLQFMYRGDYQLLESTHGSSTVDEEETAAESHDHEDDTHGDSQVEAAIISHVYVYAIADYYEVPGLQDLAIRKITEERETGRRLRPDQFLHVATVIYANTSRSAENLRRELRYMVFCSPEATVNDVGFMGAIAERPILQEFASDLITGQRAIIAGLAEELDVKTDRLTDCSLQLATVTQTSADNKKRLAAQMTELEGIMELKRCSSCRAGAPAFENPPSAEFTYTLVKVGDGYGAKCGNCKTVSQRPLPYSFDGLLRILSNGRSS